MKVKDKIIFDADEIIKIIKFHLKDEGWINVIPNGFDKWLFNQLPTLKYFEFKESTWKEKMSGTNRLLMILVAVKVDPLEICRWIKNPENAKFMRNKFNEIMSQWSKELIS